MGLLDLPQEILFFILDPLPTSTRAQIFKVNKHANNIGQLYYRSPLGQLPDELLICVLDELPVRDLIHVLTISKVVNRSQMVNVYFKGKISEYRICVRRNQLNGSSWARCDSCKRSYKSSSLLTHPPLFFCLRCTRAYQRNQNVAH